MVYGLRNVTGFLELCLKLRLKNYEILFKKGLYKIIIPGRDGGQRPSGGLHVRRSSHSTEAGAGQGSGIVQRPPNTGHHRRTKGEIPKGAFSRD